MDQFELTVFEQTTTYVQLRLTRDGQVYERGLDRAAVDGLVKQVDDVYGGDGTAHRVFGATQLRSLGEQLFGFLDGPERWFSQAEGDPRGVLVRIDAAERLRHLPWELAVQNGVYSTVRPLSPLLPVRSASTRSSATAPVANRALRVLFMATSPEGVEPELAFEAEEAAILMATADTGTDLVVEESGTLEGLRFAVESYGDGYFDVLHVSGHAGVVDGQPVFVVENEVGGKAEATADDIARAVNGRWPRLVFVSGCLTGSAPGAGTVPSMSESLVKAGAPTVLGWALPVGDAAATELAGELYRSLAAGAGLDEAIVAARRALHAAQSPYWHLLRVYADRSAFTAMVTPRNAPGREPVRLLHAAQHQQFLDPVTQKSRVASREEFVGRRRLIQRCLRTLRAPLGTGEAIEALVLHGTGGLGKSTLASRLLERMPTHQRVVWFGRVDEVRLRALVSQVTFANVDDRVAADQILNDQRLSLGERLKYVLSGPLARIPCLFVFDDFEQGNLEDRDGGHVLSPDMAEILPALLLAIREANSSSRVVITSRYRFPGPAGTRIEFEGLETLTSLEQRKKLANLPNLGPTARTPADIKQRAIRAADGNPRLLEWLDKIVVASGVDADGLMTAVENEADRFRKEDIFAERLLASQGEDLRRMLARVNVVELPIAAQAVHDLHQHPDVDAHLRRAVDLGLMEEGRDAGDGQFRYYVSNVLRPLLRPSLTDDEFKDACAVAARSLFALWVEQDTDTEQ